MRLLVAHPDQLIADTVAATLGNGAWEVMRVTDGAKCLQKVLDWSPHLVLAAFDLMEGDGDGLYQKIRRGRHIAIIAISAQADIESKLKAFAAGADDYIVIPFHPAELLARVRAVLLRGRSEQVTVVRDTITVGDLAVDIARHRATVNGKPLNLTPLEFNVLRYLMTQADRVINRRELMENVWGMDYVIGSNVVEVVIGTLRHKLGDNPRQPRFIETVARVGYRLTSPQESAP